MSKVFNPHAWLDVDKKQKTAPCHRTMNTNTGDSFENVERLVQMIESGNIDITQGYENWRNIGFSLAESLGETGRNYFHRISCFSPDYNREKCDKQYSNCLKCRGGGITIASLFWIAKTYGVLLKR
ncbi:PriCT-2 domain-containing protein [Ancylomarina sp.]|uniref:PriCT-2 domain-containing protein n=1 Tax=Ancylomarina sp. TaxID=1970196 RepID=UPI003563AFDF